MADLIDRFSILEEIDEKLNAEQWYPEDPIINQGLRIARKCIENALSVTRWIPVEDEYPESCKSVLIAFSDSSGVRLQCVGIRSATHPNVWIDMHGRRINNVTHWQSLPEPPEKE